MPSSLLQVLTTSGVWPSEVPRKIRARCDSYSLFNKAGETSDLLCCRDWPVQLSLPVLEQVPIYYIMITNYFTVTSGLFPNPNTWAGREWEKTEHLMTRPKLRAELNFPFHLSLLTRLFIGKTWKKKEKKEKLDKPGIARGKTIKGGRLKMKVGIETSHVQLSN